MPTVAELERLAALTRTLTPLTNVSAGTLIRAEDWNTVVGALVELARAVLAVGRDGAVPAHEHPDQVSVGWLDAQLRFLVQQGPLADPASSAKVDEIARKVDALRAALERAGTDVQNVRDRVADIATRDLVRQADVTAVRRTVEGLADGREDVLALRRSLTSMQADVKTAIGAAARLTVNGQPLDAGALVGRVAQLEQLRERLTRPDGSLLDASALEMRLTELTNTLVTEDELDRALASRPGVLNPDQIAGLRAEIGNNLLEQTRSDDARVQEGLRGEIAQRLGEVDAIAARAVAGAIPGVREAAVAAVRPEIAAATGAVRSELETLVGRRVDESAGALREETKAALTDLSRSIGAAATRAVEQQLSAALADVRAGLEGLGTRVSALDERSGAQDRELARLGARVEDVARTDAAARDDLRTVLARDVDRRLAEFQRGVDQRMGSLRDELFARIDQSSVDIRGGLADMVRDAALEAARGAVTDAATRLRGEMAGIAQDAAAGVENRLSRQIDERVTTRLNERVPAITENVRSSLQPQLEATLNERVDRRIADTPGLVNNLRPIVRDMIRRQRDEPPK